MRSYRRISAVFDTGVSLNQLILPPVEETPQFALADYLLYDGKADVESGAVLSDQQWNLARAALSGALQVELITLNDLVQHVAEIDAAFPEIEPPERGWLSVFDAVIAGSTVQFEDVPLDTLVNPWVITTDSGKPVPVVAANRVASAVFFFR